MNGYLVPIHKLDLGTSEFSVQKRAIFRKIKEIKELRGGVRVVRRTSDSVD